MDSWREIWLVVATSENCPMSRKISGAEADACNHRGLNNTWPQIDHSGHQEGSRIRILAPWLGELLNLSYNEGMSCSLLAYNWKRNQFVKHLVEILVTGNVVGEWWYPICYMLLSSGKVSKYSELSDWVRVGSRYTKQDLSQTELVLTIGPYTSIQSINILHCLSTIIISLKSLYNVDACITPKNLQKLF